MLLGAVGALLLCATASAAQRVQSSLDVGAVSLRYADTLSVSAAALTPDVRVDWERAIAQVSGTFSQFSSGGWSTQAAFSGSLFTTTRRSLLGELAGFAGGSAHQNGTRTGLTSVSGRLHTVSARWGGFVGAGGGATWDGSAWRRLVRGELGGWVRNDAGVALLTISPVAVNDSIRYTDGQLSLSRTLSSVDLSVLAGTRGGSQAPGVGTRTTSWASLSAVAWLNPRLGVVASGGTYPVDPTQGFPGGRFVSLSVRIGSPHKRVTMKTNPDAAGVGGLTSFGAAAAVEGFHTDRKSPGSVSLVVNAAGAQIVEVSGDFTGWIPMKLERAGNGWWSATLRLTPGQYQMNVRIDGGSWLVPPGLLSLQDEFGGSVGLLVID